MTRQHTPSQQFREAKQIARDHGCFVVEKGGNYLLYRHVGDKSVFIGQRKTAETLRRLVCKATGFH